MTEYQKYLQSDHWQQKRREAFEFYGFSCCICGGEPEEVHHRNYFNLWLESCAHDLIVLCSRCHALYHESMKARPVISQEELLFCALTQEWRKDEPEQLKT